MSDTFSILKQKIQEIFDERDYYKLTVHELADNMDKNVIEAFKWRKCAEVLYEVLVKFQEEAKIPETSSLYSEFLAVIKNYKILLEETKVYSLLDDTEK